MLLDCSHAREAPQMEHAYAADECGASGLRYFNHVSLVTPLLMLRAQSCGVNCIN